MLGLYGISRGEKYISFHELCNDNDAFLDIIHWKGAQRSSGDQESLTVGQQTCTQVSVLPGVYKQLSVFLLRLSLGKINEISLTHSECAHILVMLLYLLSSSFREQESP